MLLLLFFVFFFPLPIFLSLPPSPNVPPLPLFCVFSLLFFQSPQWRDWKQVWWRTPVTPLMKRKTTQPPKPQGQVTLGQFPLPPPPQAGHRAIAALHHPLVLKHSLSRNLCLSGWHLKTGKTLTPSLRCAESYRMFTQTEPVCFSTTCSSHGWLLTAKCWLQHYFSTWVQMDILMFENCCLFSLVHTL